MAKGPAADKGKAMKMPSESAVKEAAGHYAGFREAHGESTKDLSEAIAALKSNKGIHPGALKRAEALLEKAKKTNRGLIAVATEMAHFDYYCDVLGLSKLLEQQGQMFARPEAGESDPADEGDETEGDLRPRHMRQEGAETPPASKKH